MQNYDFPVTLEPAYTKLGKEIPRARVVVRGDTDAPIATVSTRYKLVEHSDVFRQAQSYITGLGDPKNEFIIANNGARAIGQFTFMDKTLAVAKGDLVGLRVFVENTYNARGSIKVRLGGIRLVCMNGMVRHSDVFNLSVKHTGEAKIDFPPIERVMQTFQSTVNQYKQYAGMELTADAYKGSAEAAVRNHIVPASAIENIPDTERTVWDLFNRFTYHITHKETSRSTGAGKITRLNRASKWIDDTFGEGSEQ